MPIVPAYQRDQKLRPNYQANWTVRANAEHFGAAIGRGLKGLGAGIHEANDAIANIRKLQADAVAKKAATEAKAETRELLHDPEKGYLNKKGSEAVEGQARFERELEEVTRKYTRDMPPSSRKQFDALHDRTIEQRKITGIKHKTNEATSVIRESSKFVMNDHVEEAAASYDNLEMIEICIEAGELELSQNRAGLEGWSDERLEQEKAAHTSTVLTTAMNAQLENKPAMALEFFKSNRDRMTPEDLAVLEPKVHELQIDTGARQLASGIMGTLRGAGSQDESGAPLAENGSPHMVTGQPDGSILHHEGQGNGRNINPGNIDDGLPSGDRGAIGTNDKSAPVDHGSVSLRYAGGKNISEAGASELRKFFLERTGLNASRIDGLSAPFAANLKALIEDAPPHMRDGIGIGAGFRTEEQQQRLHEKARDKYGAYADKWVRQPAISSYSQGRAVDLTFNGRPMSEAPREVRDWVHENSDRYGLHFPVGWQPGHIEPGAGGQGSTVISRMEGASGASLGPSREEIETRLAEIGDPLLRERTRKYIDARSKSVAASEARTRDEAARQLWNLVESNPELQVDDISSDIRHAAGPQIVEAAREYQADRRDPETDEDLLSGLNHYWASHPERFAREPLHVYRGQLSKADFRMLETRQNEIRKDSTEARRTGRIYADAYSQAERELQAAGLTMEGFDQSSNVRAHRVQARKISAFNNALKSEIDSFLRENDGIRPGHNEVQRMISRLLLPVVIREDEWFGDDFRDGWSPGDGRHLFESRFRPDDREVDVIVQYDAIPTGDRKQISEWLEEQNGIAPGKDQVVTYYEDILLARKQTWNPETFATTSK